MESEKGDNIAFAAVQASGNPEVAPKKTRTRSGCLNCRRRRRKCDELRPSCLNCRQRGEECEWGIKVTFRPDNASALGAEHPSMREGSRKRPRHFKIMDITSQVEKDYNSHTSLDVESPASSRQDETQSAISPPPRINAGFESINNPQRRYSQSVQRSSDDSPSAWQAETPSFYTPNSMDASQSDGVLLSADGDSQTSPISNTSHLNLIDSHHSHHSEYSDRPGPTSFGSESRRRLSNNVAERSPIHTEDAAAELLALRYMPAHLAQRPDSMNTASSITEPTEIQLPIFHDNIEEGSTLDHQMFDDVDGIFLPGSAYQELHSTLRDHLIYTARSNAPTRDGTPEAQPDMGFFSRGPPKDSESIEETRESDPESIHSSKPSEISPQREYVLWKTWIDEVAPWLDKFDNGRMFEHKLPMIAKTTPHVRCSILALCARQIERKENSKSSSESLALYQEAIHLLLPELQSKNTAVIASCVILCVLEMMSCAPKEWRRHLEGCANLLEAVGINGFVGGVEEALFWCFARMDICGALISQDLTLIPVQRWASNIDLTEDIRLFRNPTRGFDSYANFAVMLCAHCVTYLGHEPGTRRSEARWSELFGHLEDWYGQRPEEMKPILTIPAAEGKDSSPFPTVLYGNGPAVSGNQLYHTATLLMLQEKPSSIKLQKKQKSIFWHARQICAISESNTHHGAWTNSIQPIWIAGKVMSHPSEHRAILGIYERIERETGWATGWRREDLKNWWGDSDE